MVDDPDKSSFIVPSLVQRGDLMIAISTSGRSPALARKIRTELEGKYGSEYASLAVLISEVRSEMKERGTQASSDTWQEALDIELLLESLKEVGFEETKEKLRSRLAAGRG